MIAPGRVDFFGAGPLSGADPASPAEGSFASALGDAFERASGALARASDAERAFVAGGGGLQEMVLERAQADIALQIASTAASRTAQALSTLLGMQL